MIRSSKRHLDEAGEGYWQHLLVASDISMKLARASIACALHALVPALCTRTASRAIAELHALVVRRAALAQRLQSHAEARGTSINVQESRELALRIPR